MPPRSDYDALSDVSDLTGERSSPEQHEDDEEAMASAPHTPSRKRRRTIRTIMNDDEEDENDEHNVVDALEDDVEPLDDDAEDVEDDDADELDDDDDDDDDDDEEYDAPSTSRRGPTRLSGRKSTRSEADAPKASATRTSTRSAAAPSSTPGGSAGKKSLRVKLTRTPQAAAKELSPAPKPGRPSRSIATATATATATASEPSPPPQRRAKDAFKVKWKPRAKNAKDSDDDIDELPPAPDDELDDQDDQDDQDVSRAHTAVSGSNSDDSASEPDEAAALEMQAIIGKTARQLAREGGVEQSHMELPMFDPNRKKKLTENEIALRRSETARKRKNQVEKKLEDDKVETINRLLKKQVGRSRNKLRAASEEGSDEEAEQARKRGKEEMSRKALKEMPAPFFRYIDRADAKVLAVPTGPVLLDDLLGPNHIQVNTALIEQLATPINTDALPAHQHAHAQRARNRLEQQAERWKQDHALDQIWGPEGLYEYKLRTVLGQSRKDWIASRRPPTPQPQLHPEQNHSPAEVQVETKHEHANQDAHEHHADDQQDQTHHQS